MRTNYIEGRLRQVENELADLRRRVTKMEIAAASTRIGEIFRPQRRQLLIPFVILLASTIVLWFR